MGKRSAAGELILGNMGSRSSELSASLRTSTKRGCGRSSIENPRRGRPARVRCDGPVQIVSQPQLMAPFFDPRSRIFGADAL